MQHQSVTATQRRSAALWACPFRPFFLATATYAVIIMTVWLGGWLGAWPLPRGIAPMQWHSHEMLFGVVGAAIAGFLLTAMCNWTASAPLAGRGLVALFALWLAGRLAMWAAAWLPGWMIAVTDLSFLLAVAIYAGRVIWAAGNYRNLALVAIVTLLWLTNLLFHIGLWGEITLLARRAELGTVALIVLLIVVIGGRITPAFTRNWLHRNGQNPEQVRTWRWLESVVVSTTALVFALMLGGAPVVLVSTMALIAALANTLRLVAWSGWMTRRDPLMWILHAGYAWIPLGLLMLGLAPWLSTISDTAWLHAFGAGAMGVLIVGVMTRVALGHTGRTLELARPMIPAYWLIIVAAALRVGTGLDLVPHGPGVLMAGTGWIAAFALFLAVYWPILTRPRVDGRIG